MASLRAIRSRIKSVKGTQKITKAMKLVAAAKLRRAQDAVLRARPYAELIDEMLGRLGGTTDGGAAHPLLEKRPLRRVEVVVLTSDRGLAGGFNANVVRRLQRFLVDHKGTYERIGVSTIGRRGRDFAKKRGVEIRKDYAGVLGKLEYRHARQIADDLIELYEKEELDAVYLLFNKFQSALVQKITLQQLLPIEPPANEGKAPVADFVYEPSQGDVLSDLLPRHLGMQIWRALLESEASEHGARMTAMESATKNAKEMIGRLTLQYNRARQAAITKELMEIVSGAEALK
jgi:F-type H+-transporting ATPase subunit gamma